MTLEEITRKYPQNAANMTCAEAELEKAVQAFSGKWVVLDDDPTGVQTVHDLPVYTDWQEATLEAALREPGRMFYILTNSRGLTAKASEALHRELMGNLRRAMERTCVRTEVISRSDSTLRGHFPLETDLLQELSGTDIDGVIMAPFFEAGGRYTIENVHYVRQGGVLVPAAETEFAKDATFGYTQSDMRRYIEEKTGQAQDVVTVSLKSLRAGDVDAVERQLMQANGRYIVVNAIAPRDLRVFAAALYRALGQGRHFVYRTAADFVKAVGGVTDQPLLRCADMVRTKGAGVIIVGSHTQKTTAQLEALRDIEGLDFILFDSDRVLDGTLPAETERVRAAADADIRKGVTPVIFTKRTVLTLPEDTKESALLRSVAISDALTAVPATLTETPAFVIAKGGITSSDVGVKALKVRRAWVLGQVQPGIPVWQCGEESRFPGVPYVIFPGNVGDEGTLKAIVEEFL